jgi:hypothetical protein
MGNLLKDIYPHLFQELDVAANLENGIDIDSLTYGTQQIVWWRKRKTNELYQAKVFNRTSHLLAPDLSQHLDIEKNRLENITTQKLSRTSTVRAWWIHPETKQEMFESPADIRKLIYPTVFLQDSHPTLYKELCTIENESHKIRTDQLTHGIITKVWWKGPNCSHPPYKASVGQRIKNHTGCPPCGKSLGISKLKRIAVEKKSNNTITTTEVGDATEDFVLEEFKKISHFQKVIKVGNTAGNADICVDLGGSEQRYFLQVKTLSKRNHTKHTYMINKGNQIYPDNMLFVMVNIERNRFVVLFYKDIKDKKTITFNFGNKQHAFYQFMCFSAEEMRGLVSRQITSSVIENLHSAEATLELKHLERFTSYISDNKHVYERNTTNSNVTDGYINGIIRCQNKYSSKPSKDHTVYTISLKKSTKGIPYDVNDPIDFLIVELGPDKYHGKFCMIPKSELITHGITKTASTKGKTFVTVAPPDYTKPHWTNRYWNNLETIRDFVKTSEDERFD